MKRRGSNWFGLFALPCLAFCAAAQDVELAQRIRDLLQERINGEVALGFAVGVVSENGPTEVTLGLTAEGGPAVNGDTLFEIGSITKSYNGVLLALMKAKGELQLSDPVSKHLPSKTALPSRSGKEISLLNLAQHTSGLPRMPGNFVPKDSRNPYADYNAERMFEFLAACKLDRDPGSAYDYSNLGAGLLGVALSHRAEIPYGELLKERIFKPLGLQATFVDVPAGFRSRLATGHDELLRATSHWDFSVLAPAGAIKSSVRDQMIYLQAGLGQGHAGVVKAIQESTDPRLSAGSPRMEIALGWHVLKAKDGEIVWHNGGTGGFRSFLGFSRAKKMGVVVLSNTVNSVDDIGFHLLDPTLPLQKQRVVVKVPSATLDSYAGTYPLAPGFAITISRDGRHLVGQATGQPKFAMRAKSESVFDVSEVEAEVSFANVDGALELTLKQSGQTLKGKRQDAGNGPAPAPAIPAVEAQERKAIDVDAKTLQRYVGVYELDPNFTITVSREGQKLFAQATGQARFEILPESPVKFFYTVTNAQITFQKIEGEKANELILHQRGQNYPARRRKD